MLPTSLRLAILLAIIIYFVILLLLLKRKKLALRYTLLWFFSGVIMLIFTLFPQILGAFTALAGIQVQSNALFAVLFFCVLIILVSLTAINSKQNESIKRLVQQTARLENRIRELETRNEHLSGDNKTCG